MSPERKTSMIMFIIFLDLLIAFALAAFRWGANSSDGINSSEWQRRQRWLGFH